MNDFRFTLISTFLFIVIVGLGALAFFALEPGSDNGSRQLVNQLEAQLAQKDDALQEALRRISELESDNEQLVKVESPVTAPIEAETENETPSNTDSALLASLKTLRTRGVLLEPGDSGADVGTIQKFLNEFENKSGGVDNDFGPTTRRRVEAFQQAQGLTVDGGVGSGTLAKMISWLEANG